MDGGEPNPDARTATVPGAQPDRRRAPVELPPRWCLERLLGEGGQAEVWLAHDAELDELVAIKVFSPGLSPTSLERFRREARLGRSLSHPNLVKVFEVIEAGGRLALAMEWMPGGNAAQKLKEGPLPIDAVARIADETLAALAYLHERQILHRDVKPSNLLFDAEGRIHLADFGLVRPLESTQGLTRVSDAIGTPAYMSPEQIRGQDLTPAADLYSLGATLHQLLTGETVFGGPTDFEISRQHLDAPVPDLRRRRPDCPRWLARFVTRLLEKSPRDRWPEAVEARRAFVRRRSLTSPRFYRNVATRGATTIGIAAVLVSALIVVRSRSAPRTSRVERLDNTVWGVDSRGRETWRFSLGSPIIQVERADLDGDGQSETIAAACPVAGPRTGREHHAEVLVVKEPGTIVARLDVENAIANWPYEYRKLVRPWLKIVDLDGDGKPDVVALCNGRDTYASAVVAYFSGSNTWEDLGNHSGYVWNVNPVPHSSPPRFRFIAFNNRLAMNYVVSEVQLVRPTAVAGGRLHIIPSGDLGGVTVGCRWYTPVALTGKSTGPAYDVAFLFGLSGDMTLSFSGESLGLDRWGNPVPGPNAGRDLLAMRRTFLEYLGWLQKPQDFSRPDQTGEVLGKIEREMAPLLKEVPYPAILAVFAAARYSRARDPHAAIAVLRKALVATDNEDVRYRLALLEAFTGELGTARSLIEEALASPLTPAIASRGVHLLLGIAIEERRAGDVSDLAARWAGLDTGGYGHAWGAIGAALARARLWWDECQEADLGVQSWDFAPEGQAVACLARWRLGRTQAGDVAEMDEFIAANPDEVFPGQLARAAALLGLGRGGEALASIEALTQTIEPRIRELESVDEFLNREILDLARPLHAKALLAAGRRQDAIAEARRLRSTLRPGLLPAKLVNEVLHDAGRAGARTAAP